VLGLAGAEPHSFSKRGEESYGMELGYHVTLVKNGTAAFNPEGMVAAATNAPMFAHAILSTVDLLERFPTDQHSTS
jgi:nicotinamidase-related amidase